MENNTTPTELLIERVEDYAKTTITLLRLTAVDKSANMFSSVVIKITLLVVVVLFLFMLSIGLSLWIGKILGEMHYGFFAVTAMYVAVFGLLYIFRWKLIGNPVRNAIVVEMLKKDGHE